MLLQVLHRVATGIQAVNQAVKCFCVENQVIFLCRRKFGFIVIRICTILELLNNLKSFDAEFYVDLISLVNFYLDKF